MTRSNLALAFALAALSPATAGAQSREIETVWNILPVDAQPGPVTVASGTMVWTQALAPEGLVVLAQDAALSGKGKIVLQSGARLIKARAGVPVYCDVDAHKAGAAESFLMGTMGERTACLIDADRDGRFDGYFTNKVQFEGFPIARGKYPNKPDAIVPVAYRETDAASLSNEYRVGIEYRGDANLAGAHLFRVAFSGPKDKSALSDWVSVPGKGLPQSREVLGARFTVLSEDGPQVQVRIERTMPAQPFEVVRTVVFK